MAGISTIHYAVPPHAYFWQWSDEGTAIEWAEGNTLAFSEEIFAILNSLANQGGVPPLGSILLVHAACADQIEKPLFIIDRFVRSHPKQLKTDSTKKLTDAIGTAFETISKLPAELRKSTRAKAELCHTLFSRNPQWAHEEESARIIVEELHSAPSTLWSQQESPQNLAQRFLRDTAAFIKSTAGLETADLEHLIHTGIEFPDLGEADFHPDQILEKEDSRSLLEQLASAGEESRALANIAKQVIGLISLPLPATKDDDLPIGGVADIVNRGTPDKLLTSELAWGDTILATRLAQNEALYYHRETPPQNSASERIILMDHGLRYWGLPRLFALATHLGLKCHSSASDQLNIRSYLSTSDGYDELPLSEMVEVKAALSQLPVHLSFAPALNSLSESIASLDTESTISDVFLIAIPESISDPETEKELYHLTTSVRHHGGRLFLTLIDKEGHLSVYEYRARGKRLQQEGKLDLDELLPAKETAQPEAKSPQKASSTLSKKSLEKITGSKFYNQYPPPLWFPARPHHASVFQPDSDVEERVGIDTLGHLMRWSDFPDRAYELSEELPGRNHWLDQTDDGHFLVACSGNRAGESAQVFLIEDDGHAKALPIEKTKHAFPRNVVFQGDYVIFIYSDLAEAFSIQSGRKVATHESKNSPLHDKTVRVVEREISVSASSPSRSDKHQFFTDKEHLSDSTLGDLIIPSEIGFTEFASIILFTDKKNYIYSPENLTWEPLRDSKKHRFLKRTRFTSCPEMRFANEGSITTATLSLSKVTFSHDPRGILHISSDSESWSLHTHEGKGSLWKSRAPSEPRSASKQDFLDFFEKIRRRIVPKN